MLLKLKYYAWLALVPLFLSSCVKQKYVERSILVHNGYQSYGQDNYQGYVEINFRLESDNWLWQYEGSSRPKIPSGESRVFTFPIEIGRDSIFVHGRFHYEDGVVIKFVQADTVVSLANRPAVKFWNCGDSIVVEYPFSACFQSFP